MNIDHLLVRPGKKFRLDDYDPDDTRGVKDEEDASRRLAKCQERLRDLQERLWAEDSWAVLLVFQAMDAAGKDGTIKSVMSGVNPQGCEVYSFKAPSSEELDHDFMWRYLQRLPERGRIGIFNRSYYEEVLVVRVHQELLDGQKLPEPCRKEVWKRRFDDINNIEGYLAHNGIVIVKFFLNVSRKEQLERFLKRLDKPNKNWKFSENDLKERALWDSYQDAFADMLPRTSTENAPWYVIPADHKWYTRVAVAEVVVKRLEQLDLHFPEVSDKRKAALQDLRDKLVREQPEEEQ
jgi:PPK2 family polyphosphate:nucleotide phosphotransferase